MTLSSSDTAPALETAALEFLVAFDLSPRGEPNLCAEAIAGHFGLPIDDATELVSALR